MTNTKNNIYPFFRILFLICSFVGVLLTENYFFVIGFYFVLIIPLVLILDLFRVHLRLFVFGIIPIMLTFILLYIVVLKGTNGGWNFVLLKGLKILVFTSIFQITLTIPSEMLFTTFRKWRFKGDSLLTLIGAFTVWADIRTRANQIVTARFARGFIGKRNFINTAKQFPYILIPLIIGVMRTSTERVNVWEQREIPKRLDNGKIVEARYSTFINLFIVIVPILYIVVITFLN